MLSDETGVVIIPPFGNLASQKLNLSFNEADSKILFFLTYFDKVVVAPINIAMVRAPLVTSTALERTLARQEVIQTIFEPIFHQNREFDVEFMRTYAEHMFDLANSIDDRTFAISPPEEVGTFPYGDDVNCLIAVMEKALPCPRSDVPAGEIIDFRSEHGEELSRLQRALNRLFFSLTATLSHQEVSQIVEGDVKDAIELIAAEFKKRRIPFFRPDLSISYSVPKNLIGAAGVGLDALLGTPFVFGAAGQLLSFGLGKSSFAREGNKYPRDFQYVVSGIRTAVLEAFPDIQYDFDHREVELSNNTCATFYPDEIRQPTPFVKCTIRNNLVGV